MKGGVRMRRPRSLVIVVLAAATVLGSFLATGAGAQGKPSGKSGSPSCAVTPDPVASGAGVTVSGKAGKSGDWVNAYLYFSDGGWELFGGQIGSGGSFSLSGTAVETYTSYWGPFYSAVSGSGYVEIYAGSANKNLGMVATCGFSVS